MRNAIQIKSMIVGSDASEIWVMIVSWSRSVHACARDGRCGTQVAGTRIRLVYTIVKVFMIFLIELSTATETGKPGHLRAESARHIGVGRLSENLSLFWRTSSNTTQSSPIRGRRRERIVPYCRLFVPLPTHQVATSCMCEEYIYWPQNNAPPSPL